MQCQMRYRVREKERDTRIRQKLKPPILVAKPLLPKNSLERTPIVEDPAEKKKPVTTKMEEKPPSEFKKQILEIKKRRKEKLATSSQRVEMQTEKEKEDGTVTTHKISMELDDKEKGKSPHIKVGDKISLFENPTEFTEGLRLSMSTQPTAPRRKLNSGGGSSVVEHLSVKEGLNPIGTSSTLNKKDGRNSTVITHEIKKDFEDNGRGKGPHEQVREKFNLFGDTVRESSWPPTDGPKNPPNQRPPSVATNDMSNSERVSTRREYFEAPGTSRSPHLGKGFSKVSEKPLEKEEKHSTTSKEFKTTEMKKDGEGSLANTRIYHNSYHTHITQLVKEEPKHVEIIFPSYQDFQNHAAQNTIPSKDSYRKVIATNAEDLKHQPDKCKEMELRYKAVAERQNEKKKEKERKKSTWEKFWSFCTGCCLSSVECI